MTTVGHSIMALELIDKPECPFCWKVRLALEESELPYHVIPFESSEAKERLAQLTYGGTFPVLFDDDIVITDSSIAFSYLEETYNPSLLPKYPTMRVAARTIEHYASFEIGKAMRKIVLEKRGKKPEEWGLETIAEGESLWLGHQRQLAEWLTDQNYFAETFSLAECALIPRFALAEQYGAPVADDFPNLQRWFKQQTERPCYTRSTPWPDNDT